MWRSCRPRPRRGRRASRPLPARRAAAARAPVGSGRPRPRRIERDLDRLGLAQALSQKCAEEDRSYLVAIGQRPESLRSAGRGGVRACKGPLGRPRRARPPGAALRGRPRPRGGRRDPGAGARLLTRRPHALVYRQVVFTYFSPCRTRRVEFPGRRNGWRSPRPRLRLAHYHLATEMATALVRGEQVENRSCDFAGPEPERDEGDALTNGGGLSGVTCPDPWQLKGEFHDSR